MITVAIIAMRTDLPRAPRWPRSSELWRAFVPAAPALLAPVILIGSMLSGRFTPTEASSVAVVYVLIVGVFYYRDMTWAFIYRAALETVRSTAAILFIVAAAAMFGWILAVEQIPQDFAVWFKGISDSPFVLLLIVNAIFFVAGMFIDSTTATLLLVPIVATPMMAAGVDPVHLGIVVILNLMIGTTTPPFGLTLFLLCSMTGLSFTQLVRAMVPMYIPLFLTLLLLTAFPAIALLLPELLR